MALRHYGPTYINLCWVFGHILGSGILRAFVDDPTQWAWRIPYAVQVSMLPSRSPALSGTLENIILWKNGHPLMNESAS